MWWIRFKETKELFVITGRTGLSKDHGRYGLGYRDEARVITALKSSCALMKQGISWKSLELVNINGRTMQEMMDFPVEEGFALRHKTEKWYWSTRNHGRVWYRRPGDAEGAWRKEDAAIAIEADRDERRSPDQQSLQMVRGFADGKTDVLKLWFP